jgi:tetratricopeptide (TPR) repeat protein
MITGLQEISTNYKITLKDDDFNNKELLLSIYNGNFTKDFNHTILGLFHIGYYYQYVNIDYELMKSYYEICIENKFDRAMNSMGNYYSLIKDYDKMKYYYLMAIEYNNSGAMNNLGIFYQQINIDYDLMKKYYLMAIEFNEPYALFNLAVYYEEIEKNYEEMKKYYLRAIENNIIMAMSCLARYYFIVENDFQKMEYYYLMAIDNGCVISMFNIGIYYEYIEDYEKMLKYHNMAAEHYNVNAIGYLAQYYQKKNEYDKMAYYYEIMVKINNSPDALFNLGHYYEHIKKDNIKAHKYYTDVFDSKKSNIVGECIICYEDEKEMYFTRCNSNKHYTCFECCKKLYGKVCPVCRG